MKNFTPALAFASVISFVNAHGFVTSPAARQPGLAMGAACGQQVLSNQAADKYGNIQGELQVAATQDDYNAAECDIWLCKGYKFDDNKDNVHSYKAGETVDFQVDIRAPHTGVANVSIVSTAFNKVIGTPLIYWDVYASTATGVKPNQTSFSITIPEDIGSQCATANDCVLQWYWYAESIDQTYESCVDFTVSEFSSTPAAPSKAVSASSSALVTATSSKAVSESSSASVASSKAWSSKALSKASSTPSATEIAVTTVPSGAVRTPTTAAVKSTTPATKVSARPTTFATTARRSATSAAAHVHTASAEPSTSASAVPFPTDSASDVLAWIEAMLGNLVGN
ncbi:putative secreted cellulose-binding protein [Penicillium digitatum]|uniref:Putative secreted cellulose-binding protein n=3 Tax=Penicillium digitatum TaxID=36651 RepID=K9G6K3_PEND2|nr:putative secreted cellulose-binding protein [Penicillium digitatum Pd1]EKV08951.1 putative secreted cellulose-binding protein [Penicillium digitatum Pd1]EKV10423.1 putative secreted cellulose-binding protein [Penicillium digitatum PHI26]QQK41921.1 putative secreted cellulose-binding protein [Penicillium digitatum]